MRIAYVLVVLGPWRLSHARTGRKSRTQMPRLVMACGPVTCILRPTYEVLFLCPHQQYRARSMANDLFRDAAENRAGQATTAMR